MSRTARGVITLFDVADGDTGATGNAGARTAVKYLYRETTSDTVPAAPSATITWSTGVLSSVTEGWSETPPQVDATGTNRPWVSTLTFFQASSASQAASTSNTGTTPTKGFVFDGVVTFTNTSGTDGIEMSDGTTSKTFATTESLGSSGTTIIDGGRITTNTLSLSGVENTAASGARMEFNNTSIKIYDNLGNLRITIGDLSP